MSPASTSVSLNVPFVTDAPTLALSLILIVPAAAISVGASFTFVTVTVKVITSVDVPSLAVTSTTYVLFVPTSLGFS